MHSGTKLPKKKMYIILVSLSVIILSLSLETMMRVKDITLFDAWFENQSDVDRNTAFTIYVTANLSFYFQRVLLPMIFGLHTYFAYAKIRINKLFVFMWTVLLAGGLAFNVLTMSMSSVFFYVNNLVYLLLIGVTLSLIGIINENKGL